MLDRIFRVLYVVSLNPSQKYGSLEEQIFLTSVAVSQQKGLLIPVFSGEMLNKQKKQYQDAGLISESLNLSQFNLSTLRRLLRLIDHHRIEVVHWNLYHPMNGYVSSLRLLRPILRHYLTDHNSRPQSFTNSQSWLMGLYKKVMLGGYSKVLGVSDYILSELKKQAIWNNPDRYYHFVNTERFQPDERVRLATRTSQGFHGSFVILVVAHLIPEKGVDVAIRALKELPDRVVLWVIGDGPERLALQRAAESLGVHKRTLFCGLQTDVSPFMQSADCLVCPSLWQEAAGLVILEAMACGLPVIGSSVGGIPEFITPDHTGFLFPAGNHMALANHITKLCSSTPLLNNMRARARAQAVTQFSHSSRIADAVAIYKTPDP
jgi:glycosyltransferase involved in cell wall biosynthesis